MTVVEPFPGFGHCSPASCSPASETHHQDADFPEKTNQPDRKNRIVNMTKGIGLAKTRREILGKHLLYLFYERAVDVPGAFGFQIRQTPETRGIIVALEADLNGSFPD